MELLPERMRWSMGLWPMGHLVIKPSGANENISLPTTSSDNLLRLTGLMNSMPCAVTFNTEGTEG